MSKDSFTVMLYCYTCTVIPRLSNSLVPIKMCSDCETCGLLNHCKWKMIEEVTRKCVRIVRHTDYLKKHGLTRSDYTAIRGGRVT